MSIPLWGNPADESPGTLELVTSATSVSIGAQCLTCYRGTESKKPVQSEGLDTILQANTTGIRALLSSSESHVILRTMGGNNESCPDLAALRERLRAFAAERDWEQFHTPKNLAMALAVEAAELLEHFQWLSGQESERLPLQTRKAVEEELADVLNYLVRLADRLDVDLLDAAAQKIETNAAKYPTALVRGRAEKYTAYDRAGKDEETG